MTDSEARRPKRARHPMPSFVQTALLHGGLLQAYGRRPPYQQNDYIGWIMRAKLEGTRQKRLTQMLDELRQGDTYMKMAWRPVDSTSSRLGVHSEV